MTMSNYIECVQWFIILLGKTEASLQNYLIFSTIIHAAAPSPALFLPWAFHFQAFCVYSGPMKGALNLWEVFQELVKKPSGSLKRKKKPEPRFWIPSCSSTSSDCLLGWYADDAAKFHAQRWQCVGVRLGSCMPLTEFFSPLSFKERQPSNTRVTFERLSPLRGTSSNLYFSLQKIIEPKVKTGKSPKRCKESDRGHNTVLHIRGSWARYFVLALMQLLYVTFEASIDREAHQTCETVTRSGKGY